MLQEPLSKSESSQAPYKPHQKNVDKKNLSLSMGIDKHQGIWG